MEKQAAHQSVDHRRKGKRAVGFKDRYGRLGSRRRLARELLPLRRQTLRTSVNGSVAPASDRDRRAVAAVKANAEIWRARAYHAYLRTQASSGRSQRSIWIERQPAPIHPQNSLTSR